MINRIVLHLVGTCWVLLLLAALYNRRKTPYFIPMVMFCAFSSYFCLTWTLALTFNSVFFAKLNWAGALMAPAALMLLARIDHNHVYKSHLIFSWTLATFLAFSAHLPGTILNFTAVDPYFIGNFGPLDPVMRFVLTLLVSHLIFLLIRHALQVDSKDSQQILIYGLIFYCTGALIFSAVLPFFGFHEYLEVSVAGTVFWTTIAISHTFIEKSNAEQALKDLNKMKDDFIDHVTHEFRTPINAIESSVDIMSHSSDSNNIRKVRDYIEIIKRNNRRLSKFVDDLLTITKLKHSELKLQTIPFDINDVAEDVKNHLIPLAEKKGIQIKVDGPSSTVQGDPSKIEQVITNLLSNAIKASNKGVVSIKIDPNIDGTKVSVIDQGLGMNQEQQQRLFESFYHTQSHGFSKHGNGLGLSISKGLVELHGGKIWAESEGEGRGTTVTFSLPASV